MKIREALLIQSPSLQLQRAAADEIAKLDARIKELEGREPAAYIVDRPMCEPELEWHQPKQYLSYTPLYAGKEVRK